MHDYLQQKNAGNPPVEQQEGGVRPVGEVEEGVVPRREEEEDGQAGEGESARAGGQVGVDLGLDVLVEELRVARGVVQGREDEVEPEEEEDVKCLADRRGFA